jgi:hypothetical protein
VGSAGLALGGVACWSAEFGEKSGTHRRPGSSLVEVVWARRDAKGGGPEEVVHRRIREKDEHVRCYLYLLDRFPDRAWSILLGSHISYDPVSVPYLWFVSARGSAPGRC